MSKRKAVRKTIDADQAHRVFDELVVALRNAHRKVRKWQFISLVLAAGGIIATLWASGLLDGQ